MVAGTRQLVVCGLLAVLLGTQAADPAAGASANRVPNGGFETSGTAITGWRVFNLAGDSFSASLSPEARSGKQALRISRTAPGEDAGVDLWDRPLPVAPGETLRLRVAARRVGGDARSRLQVSIHEFSVTGTFLEEGHHGRLFDAPANGYGELSWDVPLTSPVAAFASIGFRLADADGTLSYPGAYLIDDVVLSGDALLGPRPARPGDVTPDADLSVRQYGARADGQSDDTAAFQRAMNDCHLAGGGVVRVPAGRYLIAGNLLVPRSVTLRGVWEAPPIPVTYQPPGETPQLAGSVLLAVAGAGNADGTPFIRLDANAGIRGLSIVYPEQTPTNPPVAYPWTVATVGADNCSIINVLMLNPYQAVDFGTHPSGRHYIRGLYADPLRRGLYVDQCLDVGRVENIHFWPFYNGDLNGPLRTYVLANCEAFIFGRTDWEYVTNCFAYGQHVGFRFIRGCGTGPHAGPGNVLLTQSGADMADAAIMVDELQSHSGLLASNCQFFGDLVVGERNVGPMRFSNCGFYGSIHGRRGVSQALLAGNGSVAFQNCHFIALHPANRAPISILAERGSLSLMGCEFMSPGHRQAVLRPDVRRAVILGNQFAGRAQLENHSHGQVEIARNVDDMPAADDGTTVIDDSDAAGGFAVTGQWLQASGSGNFGYGCRWTSPGSGAGPATWRPSLPRAGRYAVEIWYGPDPNDDHASDARFTVYHADGETRVTVNQKQGCSQWHRLGVFRFGKGNAGSVSLSPTATGNPVADAVRFVPLAEQEK